MRGAHPRSRFGRIVLCICVAALAACTIVYETPPVETRFHNVNPIPLRAVLVIAPSFRDSTWEAHKQGDTYILPIGKPLAECARVVASAAFSTIRATETTPPPNSDPAFDVVLTPSLQSVERTRAVTIFGEQVTSAAVTWTLGDRDGNVIWAETIMSSGRSRMGRPTSSGSALEQTRQLVDDFCRRSFAEISGSNEIRAFAESHSPTPAVGTGPPN